MIGGAAHACQWGFITTRDAADGRGGALLQVVPVPVDDLLSKEYAKKRRAELFLPNKVL